MSTDNVNSTPPARPRAPIVRLENYGESTMQRLLKRQVPAWFISLSLHIVLLGLIVVINLVFGKTNVAAQNVETVIDTKVEDEEKNHNFENPDIGLDPNLPTNYNIDRIDDVSVPGPLKPDEAIGNNGPGDTPVTVPPPPGIGTNEGQGGGIEVPGMTGVGAFGEKGGLGGPPLPMGIGFKGRSGATRQRMLQEGGGNSVSEATVTRGLMWLAKVQKPSGAWEIDGNHKSLIAGTGIALLPFLAAGQTHKGGAKETGAGRYVKNVDSGLKFLTGKQRGDGSFDGSAGMYDHAIATMALCEAYGMTSDPRLRPAAQRALEYIIKAQHTGGGWRYAPNSPGDTSVTGWQIQALKSGLLAGLSVPKDVATKSTQFLDHVSGGQGSQKGATYGYTDAGSSPALSAVGLLCRQYLGWGPKNPKLTAGVDYLKQTPPRDLKNAGDTRPMDYYYYYYATQVLHFYGGADWFEFWNPRMRDWLISLQVRGNPTNDGSWNPDGGHTGSAGGRLVCTCLALLTLEVYYRHLPLYKRDAGGLKDLEGS